MTPAAYGCAPCGIGAGRRYAGSTAVAGSRPSFSGDLPPPAASERGKQPQNAPPRGPSHRCRSGTGNSRKHGRPPRSHQGAPDSALGARPPSTRDSREPRRVLPIEERVLRAMERARGQSDQCGGASTTPPAVVADTTRRLWAGAELSRRRPSRRGVGNQSYPFLERCAQASFDGRHIVPQVSAPGRIRTSGLRIRRPTALSAVLNRKIAGRR